MKKPPLEWDDDKAATNLKKHGVAFEEAASVFRDKFAKTVFDPNHSFDEARWITIGYSNFGRLLFVCHAERNESIRIISARRATKQETKKHEQTTRG